MDTELLDTFVHISKSRSFTKTADAMCLTQAAVSARIKQLEILIGHPVFVRCKRTHTVGLSKAGLALLPFATDFITNWLNIRKEINNQQNTPRLYVSLYPLLSQYFFQKISTLPNIEKLHLNIIQNNSLNFTEPVVGCVVDVFITLGKPKNNQCDYQLVGLMKIGMLYNHLLDGSYLAVDWGNEINKKIAGAITPLRSNLVVDSIDFVVDFILKQGGMSYLPVTMKAKQIKQNRHYPVIDVPVYAVFNKQNRDSPVIDNFLKMIKLF